MMTTTEIHTQTLMMCNWSEEFCCLFRTRIGKVSVVYGAEMDAYQSDKIIKPEEPLLPEKFLELKTSRIIETDNQNRNFRKFKLLKWWSQSFLVGTRQIQCGWRDDDGLVSDLQTFNVKDIPKVQEMLSKAEKILGFDVLKLCMEGPESELEETSKCQPAMFIAGLAGVEKLRSEKAEAVDRCQVVAGLSLGEYTALCVAGVFDFEDGLHLLFPLAVGQGREVEDRLLARLIQGEEGVVEPQGTQRSRVLLRVWEIQ